MKMARRSTATLRAPSISISTALGSLPSLAILLSGTCTTAFAEALESRFLALARMWSIAMLLHHCALCYGLSCCSDG